VLKTQICVTRPQCVKTSANVQKNVRIKAGKNIHKIVLVNRGSYKGCTWKVTGLDTLNLSIADFAVFYPKVVLWPSLSCVRLKSI